MAIDVFDWRSLTEAVNKIAPANTFLINNIFTNVVNHASEKIDIEIISGKKKLAKFVNKGEEPQVVGKTDVMAKTITLPRIYEAKVFSADELAAMKDLGNFYVGNAEDVVVSSEKRKLVEIADLDDRLNRRIEQMGAVALSQGKITVSQPNLNFEIDFEFEDGTHLKTLTGTDKWDQSTANIMKDIRNWARQIYNLSGKNATMCLLGTNASQLFINNSKVQTVFNNWNYITGKLDLTQPAQSGAYYLGRAWGMDFYEYSLPYVDDDGNEQEAFGQNRVVLLAVDSNFRLHYGPIFRIDDSGTLTITNNKAMFANLNERKTVLEWSLESKPLPAVHNPDQVISVQVV